MSSFKQIYYQIIFGTKYRKPVISESHSTELYRYIHGLIKNKDCFTYSINGVEDHIHIFSDLHPTVRLADFVKDIKLASNDWMTNSGKFPDFEGWQVGYGAFTYNFKQKDTLINYVNNQKEHHKKETFYDEFKRLLIENGVEFDEKYLL